jgi:hypothetical protein
MVHKLVGLVLLALVVGCQAEEGSSEPSTLEGRLEVLISDDFESGESQRHYSLAREQAPRVSLVIPERLRSEQWPSGTRVRVNGAFAEGKDASAQQRFRVEGIEVVED